MEWIFGAIFFIAGFLTKDIGYKYDLYIVGLILYVIGHIKDVEKKVDELKKQIRGE